MAQDRVRFRVRLVASAITLLLVLVSGGPVAAQGSTGQLDGVVRDSLSGRPLVQARIEIRGTAYSAATDSNGYSFINSIPAGG